MCCSLRLVEMSACLLNKYANHENKVDALRLYHACVQKFGMDIHTSFENRLTFASATDVGSMPSTRNVSGILVNWDGISWDSLITGYIRSDELRHALFVYKKKQEDDLIHLNGHTFLCLLKACAALKDLESGDVLHADLARKGLLERDIFIGSALIDMYAKCGSIVQAQEVFDKLPYQNVVCWTALIAGYTKLGYGDEALKLVEEIQHVGIISNSHMLVCTLKACSNLKAMEKGKEVHAEIMKRGMEGELLIGNTLVDLYARCGALDTAHAVLEKLWMRNAVPWNALITGYVEHGYGEEALHCFELMQHKGIIYDCITLSCCLKACGCVGAPVKGEKIHSEIYKAGMEKDHLIGSFLVDMYAKCGSLVKAQQVLTKLLIRDVVSWTALITGYANHGYDSEALDCFEKMRYEGISPNVCTLICCLKACGSVGSVEKGERVHIEIVQKGLESDLLIRNTLIDMYAKCGLLVTAQVLFGKLLKPDVVSWNALMAGYVEHGCVQETFHYYEQMQQKGIPYDGSTLVCCLKACASVGAGIQGQEMHAEICKKGLERDLLIGNRLVDMYARSDLLASARNVFDRLFVRDIFSWNTLLVGYTEHWECMLGDEARTCAERMQDDGISPNAHTYICLLKVCGSKRDTHKGRELYADVVKKGLEKEHLVGHALVDMYSKCSLLGDALDAFDRLEVKEVVSSTTLIAGYVELGMGEKALTFFESLQDMGIFPDAVMLVYVLRTCLYSGSLCQGQNMHAAIARVGLETDISVGSMLIRMYAKHGLLAEAQEVSEKLNRNVLSWSALISAYTEHGFGEKAIQCLDQMLGEGIPSDCATIVCTLKACGSIGASVKGQELHTEIANKGLERDLLVGNTLIDMYSKCGWLVEALEVFNKLQGRDVISWNAAIVAYAQLGEFENVFHSFKRMEEEGLTPDPVSFMNALNAWSHEGLVDEGWICFGAMSNDYGLVPVVEHYTCMADLLGRAGLVDQAGAMIRQMPLHPDMVGWFSVLGACQKWGNLELGRHAFTHAVHLDGNDTSAYICMSNIFAGNVQ